jgi:hypothetical protein
MVDKVSGNPKVFEEAAKRKRGGKACGPVSGKMAKMRMDRPKRARGGGVGSDKHPFSSAHKG